MEAQIYQVRNDKEEVTIETKEILKIMRLYTNKFEEIWKPRGNG